MLVHLGNGMLIYCGIKCTVQLILFASGIYMVTRCKFSVLSQFLLVWTGVEWTRRWSIIMPRESGQAQAQPGPGRINNLLVDSSSRN